MNTLEEIEDIIAKTQGDELSIITFIKRKGIEKYVEQRKEERYFYSILPDLIVFGISPYTFFKKSSNPCGIPSKKLSNFTSTIMSVRVNRKSIKKIYSPTGVNQAIFKKYINHKKRVLEILNNALSSSTKSNPLYYKYEQIIPIFNFVCLYYKVNNKSPYNIDLEIEYMDENYYIETCLNDQSPVMTENGVFCIYMPFVIRITDVKLNIEHEIVIKRKIELTLANEEIKIIEGGKKIEESSHTLC